MSAQLITSDILIRYSLVVCAKLYFIETSSTLKTSSSVNIGIAEKLDSLSRTIGFRNTESALCVASYHWNKAI